MGIKSLFKPFSGKPIDSFDQVKKMVTRQLPVPGEDDLRFYIQFLAEKTKTGHWSVSILTNSVGGSLPHGNYKESHFIAQTALIRHSGKKSVTKEDPLNFDTVFMILREIEEAHLKAKGIVAGDEPKHHFMAAYRLLPKAFGEGYDEIYRARLEKDAQPAPAAKPPEP